MEKAKRLYSGTLNKEHTVRETVHAGLARKLAADGIVLLRNDGQVLPLDVTKPAALFGSGADHTIKGGTGSGDVNNRYNISIYTGLKEAGISITSTGWIEDYNNRYMAARNLWREKVREDASKTEDTFEAYASNPFLIPGGRDITDNDIKGASVAIYVISRISGEGRDRRKSEGDYYLSSREREDILCLDSKNIPVILILNTGAPIELAGILKETTNIKAILNISLPGQEGGNAVADVLAGKIVPSGKLASTWAVNYEDYPCAESFSYLDGDLSKEEYREGIYAGYRYFSSFGIKPLFPFGYGLSYTSFSIKFEGLDITGTQIKVKISVKNTGKDYPGREVVQVYITPPQTGTAKEYHRLAGFAKTDILKPGETKQVIITIEQKQIAGFSEETGAWVIGNGKYGIWAGNSSISLSLEALIDVEETVVIENTDRICKRTIDFKEAGSAAFAKDEAEKWLAEAEKQEIPVFTFIPHKEEKAVCKTPYMEKGQTEDLITLLHGKITDENSMFGSAGINVPGSAGETAEITDSQGRKLCIIMADGPAGLRLQQSYETDRQTGNLHSTSLLASLENGFLEEAQTHEDSDMYYQFCTAFPVGTVVAQTWDISLAEEFGRAVAAEMEEFNIGLWLAPGMNIQRNPLCGRNFEYYSEDPLVSGVMAAAVTKGVQNSGKCGVTIKHFVCNNQEDNRTGVDACISERALREIYLRGFEIAVKESAPAAIMTSYNCINGIHAANSKDLCTTVARGEWGFEGVFISDWSTTAPEDGSVPWKCVAAGNDIIMPGSLKDDKDIKEAYAQGKLAEDEIRACAGRVNALIEKLGRAGTSVS
ncbi:MAG: beta-glucosidase [Lachnospiraceae bacterium]|nr:beta-glucosidase [Lachnospiraceae bacterium]